MVHNFKTNGHIVRLFVSGIFTVSGTIILDKFLFILNILGYFYFMFMCRLPYP